MECCSLDRYDSGGAQWSTRRRLERDIGEILEIDYGEPAQDSDPPSLFVIDPLYIEEKIKIIIMSEK